MSDITVVLEPPLPEIRVTLESPPPEIKVTLSEVGLVGPPGPGFVGAYTHTQTVPSTVWVVSHNLGVKPQPFVLDEGGAQMFGFEVTWPSLDVMLLIFPSARLGTCTAS